MIAVMTCPRAMPRTNVDNSAHRREAPLTLPELVVFQPTPPLLFVGNRSSIFSLVRPPATVEYGVRSYSCGVAQLVLCWSASTVRGSQRNLHFFVQLTLGEVQ